MARKKITSLLGDDPIYSKQFGNTPKKPDQLTDTRNEPLTKSTEANEKAAEPVKPKSKAAVKPKKSNLPARSKPDTARKVEAPTKPKTRAVHVRAAPKVEHQAGLEVLEASGLTSSDVVRLAGKRAIKRFDLKGTYVKPEDVDRLPSDMSFRTMKTLDAGLLDKLRDQADPLRLRSDAAVIQGQLEPIFWDELTTLIKELRKKYS